MDDLLIQIYSNLVNSHRPQISTIQKVIARHCSQRKVRGSKRPVFIWNPKSKTEDEIKRITETQTSLGLDFPITEDHNSIIEILTKQYLKKGYSVHVGETEQRKSPVSANLSHKLTGLKLVCPPKRLN